MFHKASLILIQTLPQLALLKDKITQQWIDDSDVTMILKGHAISVNYFRDHYASGVFNFFMDVLESKIEVGDCPVIGSFLEYLKDREICADELFVICSQFRQTMIDYGVGICDDPIALSKELSNVFDRNFSGVLKSYTDTIFAKEQEIAKNVKLLGEYKKAIDASAIVSKTDTVGMITYINDNFIRRCGYRSDELIGTRHDIVWDETESQELFERIHEKMLSGETFHETVKNRKKSSEIYYVDMTMIPIYDHNNEICEYMEISYEVTTLIEATREAVAADKAKEYFLSNMSHEIRTPLNAILGFVSLLEDEVVSDRHQQYLNIIYNSGENLLSIMNDILDFSKLQSGEFIVDPQPFNIHEELSKTLELFVSSANEKQTTLLSYFDPKIPHILVADILRIKQIISNFISNAIKFSPPSSTIEVRVSCDETRLAISIRDWGIGLSENDLCRIFDPFSQVKSDAEKILAGTGLGLAICKKLAEHMDGKITVTSTKGEGSLFTLEIPVEIQKGVNRHLFDPEPFKQLNIALLRKHNVNSKTLESLEYYLDFFDFPRDVISIDDVDAYDLILFLDEEIDTLSLQELKAKQKKMIAIMEHLSDRYDHEALVTPLFFPFYCAKIHKAFSEAIRDERQQDTMQRKMQRRFNAKVLVAEDNSANQELIKVILERYGIDFVIVSDGLKAVEYFKKDVFNMVLMDEQMPMKTGIEATMDILNFEASQERKHTPIIALTANVIKGAKERGLESGYDEFLGKPIVIKELERVFERYLDELESQTHEYLEYEIPNASSGIDYQTLQKELQLDVQQLKVLLAIYVKKMDEILPKLYAAMESKDLALIRKLSHNIKGSSANFRFSEIQRISKVIEESAADNDADFEFKEAFKVLEEEYQKISLI
ncbi:MAG: ATP-binding protein [Campylobacterota bacterium]|nr:ATP-binding protein [Campylobacterota bacterium]